MWDMTDSDFRKAVPGPKLYIEITAFGGPTVMKTTALHKIRKMLNDDGFITRINEETIPGMASKLDAVRGQSSKLFPKE